MREDVRVRQVPGERRRRWFSSASFDLIVWLDDSGGFSDFELCYDKESREKSIVWRSGSGFCHMAIDDGESRPGKYKAAPVLIADGSFEAERVRAAFAAESGSLPRDVAEHVLQVLERHPNCGASGMTAAAEPGSPGDEDD